MIRPVTPRRESKLVLVARRGAILARYRQKATQFQPGESGNPTGKAKEQAHTDSCEPVRDAKAEHARSTVGRIAAKANVSAEFMPGIFHTIPHRTRRKTTINLRDALFG